MTEPDNIAMRIGDMRLLAEADQIDEVVFRHEILGVAGLDGHGQDAFLEAISGYSSVDSGHVEVQRNGGGETVQSYAHATRLGLAYLPADRRRNGLFPQLSVMDNFLLNNPAGFSRLGWLRVPLIMRELRRFREELSMVFESPNSSIRHLSGGNQQKVLLARTMASGPDILLLNDPTRGVDIQTRQSLYRYFRNLVDAKKLTIVLLSTELDELVELCDRVFVFRNHSVHTIIQREALSLDRLMAAMFGREKAQGETA